MNMSSTLFTSFTVVALAAATWTAQTSGVTSTLRGATAASEQVAWVSGSGATMLKTEDGGTTWVKQTVADDAVTARLDFRDVDAIDAKTVYALSIGNGPASRIYRTNDGGATWALQFKNEDPKGFYDAMTFWDADHGLVIGDSIDNKFQILITDNGGKTWTKVPDAALPPALDNEGAFAGSGTNIAVFGTHAWIGTGAGPKSRMLHTADRGKSWTVADTPIVANASTGIFSVAFRDAQHGVAIGGDYSKEKLGVDNAAITSDGGKTWTLVKVSGFRSVVRYIPGAPTSLIAVGPQGADMSTDDGKTWTPMEIPAPMTGWHTLALSPNGKVGFAAGGRGAVAKVDLR
jgi:photosystem II stability/assembly factor-like uncharacterized protein